MSVGCKAHLSLGFLPRGWVLGKRGAHLVVIEVPVDGEAVAADAPLLAGGAGAAPVPDPNIAPCPHQLRRLLRLCFGAWKRRVWRRALRSLSLLRMPPWMHMCDCPAQI